MQEQSYKDRFGLSQSAIKDFWFKSPKKWKEIWLEGKEDTDKKESVFLFGDVSDTMLFRPDEFDNIFSIGQFDNLSAALETIVKDIFHRLETKRKEVEELNKDVPEPQDEILISLEDERNHDIILEALNSYTYVGADKKVKKGWNTGWLAPTRIKAIIEKGSDYFNSLVKAEGRKVISPRLNLDAIEVKSILCNHEDTKSYFVPTEGIDLEFQKEIFVEYVLEIGQTITLKGALDILKIDHKNKTIQIIDFKTTFDAHAFFTTIRKWGYITQLSFYDFILRIWLDKYCDNKYCEYTILKPINIVIDRVEKTPYIYEYNWDVLALEREGNSSFLYNLFQTQDHNAKIKKGFVSTIEEIGWHILNNKWDKPKELYENKKITISINV